MEEKKVLPDLVVLMTENFPFRKKGLHDKMIKVGIMTTIVFLLPKEKGSIFQIKLILDGTVPKKLEKKTF